MLRRLSWSPLHFFVLDMASLIPCRRIAFVPEQGEPMEPASRCSLSSVNASSHVFDAVISQVRSGDRSLRVQHPTRFPVSLMSLDAHTRCNVDRHVRSAAGVDESGRGTSRFREKRVYRARSRGGFNSASPTTTTPRHSPTTHSYPLEKLDE